MMKDNSYNDHRIFKQLERYAEFYKNLSFSVFPFMSQGTKSIFNLDSYLFSSIQGTLESINAILVNKRINDAYALLRKYHDSIIINIYTDLYLEDHCSIENLIVKKIDDWREGSEKLPYFREMSNYIRNSEKLQKINNLLYGSDKIYKQLRERCNDHTHYNFYKYVLLNNNEIYNPERTRILDVFSRDLADLFVMHFSYLFYLNEHYMMASDYVDSLDLGLEPEENSQYFVAPFVQEIFDSEIKKRRMDLAEIIKKKTSMMLE